jgi:hypothetical protein
VIAAVAERFVSRQVDVIELVLQLRRLRRRDPSGRDRRVDFREGSTPFAGTKRVVQRVSRRRLGFERISKFPNTRLTKA